MLEPNKYYIQEIQDLNDLFLISYVIIDDIYQRVVPDEVRLRRNYKVAKLSDSEIITLSIIGEMHGISSERAWLNYISKNFKHLFPNLCSRTRFNRTRRHLERVINLIRIELSHILGYTNQDIYIVDSMPIKTAEFGRAYFSKSHKGDVGYGYCASKKERYYGFKLHASIALDGYITNIELTPANIDDRKMVRELFPNNTNAKYVLADKGYISEKLAEELKEELGITLLALKRDNSKDPYPKELRNTIGRHRRRIETTFSQLHEQFQMGKILTHTIIGLKVRIQSKILGHNIAYFINVCLGNPLRGQIKHLIF